MPHLRFPGNQGVGKNKLADRLLQLLQRERQYVQLHRDTTVQGLTLTPSLVDGVVVWEDSPLVKAVREGHVLVVDEADKAPLEVAWSFPFILVVLACYCFESESSLFYRERL